MNDSNAEKKLTFNQLAIANLARVTHFGHTLEGWSPTDWACAMAGEVGEACNLVKKLRRGEDIPTQSIAEELADVVTYADLLAQRLGIDLGEAVRDKFNRVSERVGSDVKIDAILSKVGGGDE